MHGRGIAFAPQLIHTEYGEPARAYLPGVVAAALPSGKRFRAIRQTNFFGNVANYFIAAGAATGAIRATRSFGFRVARVIVAPAYLTYRTHRVYLGGLDAQQRAQENSDLHLATIEALAAAVLTNCGERDAETRLRELQRTLESVALGVDDHSVVIGLSAGAAIYPADGDTSEELLTVADRRMYSDKANRRRRASAPTGRTAASSLAAHLTARPN